MKLLIITFTSGNNPGTFMQGLGVQTALKKLWPDAQIDFLKFPDFKASYGIIDSNARLWHTLRQKVVSAYRLLKYNRLRKQIMNFTPTIDLFNYNEDDEAFIRQYDLVVIGSDTILEKAYGKDGSIGLNWMPLKVKKIYFAASASPAIIESSKELKAVAANAEYIGLRDYLTVNFFVNKLCIDVKRIVKQPDPSYFLDINQFKLSKNKAKRLKKDGKYALCNFMSNFPLRKDIADALRGIGYTIVSTAYNPYADISLDTLDAYEWAGVFRLMNVIVTERFHDSVFGLRNERPVVAIDWDPARFNQGGDSKTMRILEDYKHEHLHFNLCGVNDLSQVINAVQNIDNLFDLNTVRRVNEYQNNRLNEILQIIKTTVSL